MTFDISCSVAYISFHRNACVSLHLPPGALSRHMMDVEVHEFPTDSGPYKKGLVDTKPSCGVVRSLNAQGLFIDIGVATFDRDGPNCICHEDISNAPSSDIRYFVNLVMADAPECVLRLNASDASVIYATRINNSVDMLTGIDDLFQFVVVGTSDHDAAAIQRQLFALCNPLRLAVRRIECAWLKLKQARAAKTIQRYWRQSNDCPGYAIWERRMRRDWLELIHEVC